MSNTNETTQDVTEETSEPSAMSQMEKRASFLKKKKAVEEFELDNKYAKALRAKALGGKTKSIKDVTNVRDLFGTMTSHIALQRRAHRQKKGVSFIHPDFDQFFSLQPSNVIAVLGYTGGGKTTTAANITASLLEMGKRVAIIANEEPEENYRSEVTCILAGISSVGLLNKRSKPDIDAYKAQLAKGFDNFMYVADANTSDGATTNASSILTMLTLLNDLPTEERPECVIIDYLQNITSNESLATSSTSDQYSILDGFCKDLKNITNELRFAVVVMAQMHSDDKRKGSSADTKLIMGGSLLQNSMKVVEVRADHVSSSTTFKISKNRNGNGLGEVTLTYKLGRYTTRDVDYERAVASKNSALAKILEEI